MTTKLLTLLSIVTCLNGCATNTPSQSEPPEYCTVAYETQLPEFRKVALVTSSEPPIIEANNLGYTRGEGAAAGAAYGAAGGAAIGLSTLPASLACGPLAFVCVGGSLALTGVLAVGGAVVGTAAGVATGSSEDTIAEAEANAQAMLDSAYLQRELLQRAEDYGLENLDLELIRLPSASPESLVENQAYTGLQDESIDAVLEVELRRISFDYSLRMEASSRLVSSRTGDVLCDNKHVFQSESHSLNEWTENGAAQIGEAIQRGLTALAKDVVNEDFLLSPRKGDRTNSPKVRRIWRL